MRPPFFIYLFTKDVRNKLPLYFSCHCRSCNSGSILQTSMYLKATEKTTSAAVSLFISAASTAYTSATLSYDFDTSVSKRRDSPKMYGYMPDEGRSQVFLLMFLLSLLQVATKVFATALLALTNFNWLVIWLASDMGLFFLYKIARRDLIYFVPLVGWTKFAMAVFQRFTLKVVSDYSGVLFLRGPYGKISFSVAFALLLFFLTITNSRFQSWAACTSRSTP